MVNKLNQLPNSRMLAESILLTNAAKIIPREIKQVVSVTEDIAKDGLLISKYVQEIEKKLSCDEISDIASFIGDKSFVELWLGMTEAMYLLSSSEDEFNIGVNSKIIDRLNTWKENVDAATISGFTPIITVKSNIQTGEKLLVNSKNIAIRMAADTYVPLGALTPDDYESVKGRYIKGPFKAGSIIVNTDLEK